MSALGKPEITDSLLKWYFSDGNPTELGMATKIIQYWFLKFDFNQALD
jgi:hypothetical protein